MECFDENVKVITSTKIHILNRLTFNYSLSISICLSINAICSQNILHTCILILIYTYNFGALSDENSQWKMMIVLLSSSTVFLC